MDDDPVDKLDTIVYGILFPMVLVVGFFGSVINLIVLFTTNLKAAHFVYMRGMSICDLLTVIATIPFAIQMCENRTEWPTKGIAWYYAHLELFLMNIFSGGDVLLTVAITTERYLAFCHPFKARTLHLTSPRHSHVLAVLLPIVAAVLYIPYTLQNVVLPETRTNADNSTYEIYKVEENCKLTDTVTYTIYTYSKEVIFRIAPGIVLVVMNVRIIVTYQRASVYLKRRQFMRIRVSSDEVIELQEGKRLMLVLGGLSVQFIVCTTPAAILALMINEDRVEDYPFAVFRAVANLLEIIKNSSTFFVYCLCSGEYRYRFMHCAAKQTNKIHMISVINNNNAKDSVKSQSNPPAENVTEQQT